MQNAKPPLSKDPQAEAALSGAPCGGDRDRGTAARFELPAACDRIIIVGAGGFGREVLQWARAAWPECMDRIAGFLSADTRNVGSHDVTTRILGTPDEYQPAPRDGLVLAVGLPAVRRRLAESLLSRGGTFLTLVHPTAIVATTATIGVGSILCPFSIASDSSTTGRFVLVNYHASLGHDARADDFAVLSPYATLGGAAYVGDDVFLGLHASVGPGRTVGARSKVSANSCALADAPPDSLIFGVPGRVVPRPPLME